MNDDSSTMEGAAMTNLSAENLFREGLAALASGRAAHAAECFEQAMRVEKQGRSGKTQMRFLSYFGLSVALSGGASREAIRACETAVRNESYNADLLLNLGKVYLMAGRTTKALAVFDRGLKLDPRHKGLQAALMKADRRRRPPLAFLDRSHPLNYYLGRMRR
jgi:tetratricopeptide (TPR) repeat protein